MRGRLQQLREHGHVILRAAVDIETIASMRDEARRIVSLEPDRAHGMRGLMKRSPLISAWARSPQVVAFLPEDMQPVRGILFDKTPDANWNVAWHQDLTIAVTEKVEVPGYGPWSVKDGVVHVQPPMAVLETMITLRLHLDDTPAGNGALRVIPRSHVHSRLSAEQISDFRLTNNEHVCSANAGDLLMMKPLILHASSAAREPAHRRVVHLEYAPKGLLNSALSWAG